MASLKDTMRDLLSDCKKVEGMTKEAGELKTSICEDLVKTLLERRGNLFSKLEKMVELIPDDIDDAPKEKAKPKEKPLRVCPVCREKNHEPGAKFCHKCGAIVDTNETDQGEEKNEVPRPKKRNFKTRRKSRRKI